MAAIEKINLTSLDIRQEQLQKPDKKDDIRLFVRLPSFIIVETTVGTYNSDWAIVKRDDAAIHLVREIRSTKDFEKLHNIEADEIKCG